MFAEEFIFCPMKYVLFRYADLFVSCISPGKLMFPSVVRFFLNVSFVNSIVP